MSIFDHPIISQRYFFPREIQIEDPVMVPISCGMLRCFYRIQNLECPTVVFFHGNGECVGDYIPHFTDALSSFGVNVFLAEYRGYGGSDGTPQLYTMLKDVHSIHRFLEIEPSKIFVFGRSVGSIYALEYASSYPIKGLILESAIASPLERIALRVHPNELGVEWSQLKKEADQYLNHQRKISLYDGPTLILHAHNDFLVDVSHTE
ncbi:MAG: alpha/beta fold hydrolase, partial [Myxococcota bacterium]|nr:alpha/beta fold hydrolase [Myxococcota bacterium]